MSRINRVVFAALMAAAFALLLPALASAHERRDLGEGRYSVVIGFSSEPAFTGFLNGLDFRVSDNSITTPAADGGEPTSAPVEGLEGTMQAEIIYGDQTMPLTLEPRFRAPGAYDAWVVPMAAGDYTFHIFGTIGDLQVDETFTSSPEGFSSVTDQTVIQFPKASATTDAPTFGTVTDSGGFNIDGAAAGAAGLVIGAAGLALFQRRRSATPRLTAARAGARD